MFLRGERAPTLLRDSPQLRPDVSAPSDLESGHGGWTADGSRSRQYDLSRTDGSSSGVEARFVVAWRALTSQRSRARNVKGRPVSEVALGDSRHEPPVGGALNIGGVKERVLIFSVQ